MIFNALTGWLSRLQRILLPPHCLLCGNAGTADLDLCAGCIADLPCNVTACVCCARPLAIKTAAPCATCQSSQTRPFSRSFIPFCYKPPLNFLLIQLKFNRQLSHAHLLGNLFKTALAEHHRTLPDIIVPVPLHPLRLQERGFNQAVELARTTAHHFQIPLLINGLQRTRHTTPQTRLDAKRRRTNLKDAFSATGSFSGTRIALMDDIVTTGSTTSECARALQAAGATDIEIWAIAHTASV
ncbi:MAG: amidophosphoribosyltransferase [Candidatus Contendobacter odensis]|uniref:Amidophosphoribosyltransferase n=1 Tax=Candidatus Contendibacter odensensis TaxID=1400860 RepID=A0A2G6PF41_9GAMM|nr:MAG: amidophosphoribosyltransferase [Candidatus Contendobacter odensis]